jgi:hypothetical protein
MKARSAADLRRSVVALLCLSVGLGAFAARGADAKSFADNIKRNQDQAADSIEKIPASTVKLYLLSLDPGDDIPDKKPTRGLFHEFGILGKVEITSVQEKTNLLAALARGVRDDRAAMASCFRPRHGLSIVDNSTTNDLVICFECGTVAQYGLTRRGFAVSHSPQDLYDRFLARYRLPKAK